MIKAHPVWGVGMGNFVTNAEQYSSSTEVVRFVQPVHNLPLLILTETGLLGLILIYLILQTSSIKFQKSLALSLILLTSIILLDHYLLTIQSGVLLLIIIGVNCHSREV